MDYLAPMFLLDMSEQSSVAKVGLLTGTDEVSVFLFQVFQL
jgi:hypothetical protein